MTNWFGSYGASYRRAVARQVALRGEKGFEASVGGGEFAAIGALERGVIDDAGLPADGFIADIGCGVGRLAAALNDRPALRYLGLDVAPALLARAQSAAGRPDWRFEIVTEPAIPVADETVDIVAMFSVATHLPHSETCAYLREAARALKSGGAAVVSFLDPETPQCRRWLRPAWIEPIATRLFWAPNVATTVEEMRAAAAAAKLCVERLESPSSFGQSLARLRKPA